MYSKIIEECIKDASSKYSNLQLVDIDHNQISISGGLNGNGNWRDYFSDLVDLIDNLNENFSYVWVNRFFVDPIDDVFNLVIGVDDYNE